MQVYQNQRFDKLALDRHTPGHPASHQLPHQSAIPPEVCHPGVTPQIHGAFNFAIHREKVSLTNDLMSEDRSGVVIIAVPGRCG